MDNAKLFLRGFLIGSVMLAAFCLGRLALGQGVFRGPASLIGRVRPMAPVATPPAPAVCPADISPTYSYVDGASLSAVGDADNTEYLGIIWTVPASGNVCKVGLQKNGSGGDLTGTNITVAIWNIDGSSNLVQQIGGSTTNATSIADGWHYFSMTNAVSVTNGSSYAITATLGPYVSGKYLLFMSKSGGHIGSITAEQSTWNSSKATVYFNPPNNLLNIKIYFTE